jgi:flagellar hook-associated protein 3 FlgL
MLPVSGSGGQEMRVSSRMLQSAALNELGRVWARTQSLSEQISTGRRILRASDDPIGADHVMKARSDLRALAQYKRNLQESQHFATATESVLMRIVDLGDQVQGIALQAADDAYGESSMQALAAELDTLLEELFTLANSSYAGQRLFGGFQTREEVFVKVVDEDGRITGVQSDDRGLAGDLQRRVGDNVMLTINLTGTDVFGEGNRLFEDLITLRDAALNYDHEAAGAVLEPLQEDLDRINLGLALSGGLISRMNGIQEWLDHQEVELEAARSQHEDVDMAEAALALEQEQAVLEAALSATARLMNISLVSYLQ